MRSGPIIGSEPDEKEGSNWSKRLCPALMGETDVPISKEIGTRTGVTKDPMPDPSFPNERQSLCRHACNTFGGAEDSVRGCVTHTNLERRS